MWSKPESLGGYIHLTHLLSYRNVYSLLHATLVLRDLTSSLICFVLCVSNVVKIIPWETSCKYESGDMFFVKYNPCLIS